MDFFGTPKLFSRVVSTVETREKKKDGRFLGRRTLHWPRPNFHLDGLTHPLPRADHKLPHYLTMLGPLRGGKELDEAKVDLRRLSYDIIVPRLRLLLDRFVLGVLEGIRVLASPVVLSQIVDGDVGCADFARDEVLRDVSVAGAGEEGNTLGVRLGL